MANHTASLGRVKLLLLFSALAAAGALLNHFLVPGYIENLVLQVSHCSLQNCLILRGLPTVQQSCTCFQIKPVSVAFKAALLAQAVTDCLHCNCPAKH